ncbi:Transmembrane protein 94, partial [Larimichthys crocea]
LSSYTEVVSSQEMLRCVWRHLVGVLKGESQTLCYTSSLLHTLGSVTVLCCVDKQGILSWPNPSPETVLFFSGRVEPPHNSQDDLRDDLSVNSYCRMEADDDRDEAQEAEALLCLPAEASTQVGEGPEPIEMSHDIARSSDNVRLLRSCQPAHTRTKHHSGSNVSFSHDTEGGEDDPTGDFAMGCPEAEAEDFVCDYHLEMLSLSQDQQNPASIQFDDLSWQCHLPSLKPLGLNIMLNLCNASVTQQLCRFSDHLSNLALQESHGTVLPVYVPWGLCELSRLIGFTPGARELFKQENHLALYQLPSGEKTKEFTSRRLHYFTKRQPPISHLISLFVRDSSSNNVQMLSHGSADLILEACTDFWDGTDIYPLSGSDRKKVLDFYQRACLSGYCSAFAYKPMQVSLSTQLNGKCVELAPGPCLFSGVDLPSTTPIKHNSCRNSWSSDEGIGEGVEREDCVQALSGQIFMGMVSSQFQARLDTVRLIDALVTACIRFVYFSMEDELRSKVFAEKMGLETGWNCHISLTPNGDSPCDGAPSSPSQGSLHEDLNQDSRDEAEGPLLLEEEAHSDLASFQPTDSDVPSFLEDCNRAKLPRGIHQVRPHLKNIDNVPLLVPLFTDCTPDTMCEMMKIMQENREVTCCLGSSANFRNSRLFLQSDVSIALDPLYPSQCSWETFGYATGGGFNGEARHTTYGIRKCFLFLLQCQLSLVIIQTQNYFLGCFLLKFGLTVCAYLLAFGFTLQEVCRSITLADNTTVSCLSSVFLCNCSSADGAPIWFNELSNGLLLTQKVMAGFLALHTVVISLSYVHRSQPLWRKSPFSNTWWCLTVPVVLLSQIVQATVDYQLWRHQGSPLTFNLGDIPLLAWLLVSVSLLLVVVVNEVVKLHEIRASSAGTSQVSVKLNENTENDFRLTFQNKNKCMLRSRFWFTHDQHGIKAFNPGRKVSGALKTSAGELDELLQSQTGSIEKRAGWSVWSIPLGAQRVMDAVKESHKSSLSSGRMVALAAGLSVGATVGYMVYRHISSTNNTQEPSPEVSKMTLPVEVYRNISRYQAKFLDMVTQKSGAHVRVLSDSGEPACKTAVCFLLQGSKEQILLARCVLENLVTDCEPVTEALEVPQTAFGRIIEKTHGPGAKGNVTITGTRQEVQQAKELIVEKVREDTMVRTKISQSSALRQKRGHTAAVQRPDSTETEAPVGLNNNSLHSQVEKNRLIHANGTTGEPKDVFDKMEELKLNTDNNKEEDSVSTDSLSEISKFEIPSPDLSFQPDEHLEVYVSAYENPNHFWIQILGVRSLQLDKLTEEMNRFYNSSNPTEQRVETIVVGDIVAAPYKDHGTWNRARVLGVLSSGLVDLYYVDFGDNGELPRDGLCRMRSDFLSLPFQAIECNLAGVRPKEEVWTEGALDEFERLTHCASWRPLQAKLCSYSHSEISSWPSVKLYDNSDGKTSRYRRGAHTAGPRSQFPGSGEWEDGSGQPWLSAEDAG